MTSVLEQDRGYRKGLVLGLTMAEIVILLIFCLLLALASLLISKDKEIAELREEKEALESQQAALQERYEVAVAANDQFDDKFQELILAKDQSIADLQKENAALAEKLEALEQLEEAFAEIGQEFNADTVREMATEIEDLRTAKPDAKNARQVEKLLEREGLPTEPVALRPALKEALAARDAIAESRFETAREAIEQAEKAEALGREIAAVNVRADLVDREATLLTDALAEAGLPTEPEKLAQEAKEAVAVRDALAAAGLGSPQEAIEKAKSAEALERENAVLQDRFANVQEGIDAVGKGTEMPSCWVVPGTTKTEYIFDVALTSSGLIVRDRDVPEYAAEKQRLPIEITFGQDLPPGEFLRQTRPLFEWSVRHGCRFFVQAFDRTASHEKELFKKRLRTLEQRFYKLLVQGEAW